MAEVKNYFDKSICTNAAEANVCVSVLPSCEEYLELQSIFLASVEPGLVLIIKLPLPVCQSRAKIKLWVNL